MAESHNVCLIVRSAFRDWFDMMDRVGLDVPSVSPAHLVEVMLVKECSPDSFPVRAISSLCSWFFFDAVVASHHEALMFLAVA